LCSTMTPVVLKSGRLLFMVMSRPQNTTTTTFSLLPIPCAWERLGIHVECIEFFCLLNRSDCTTRRRPPSVLVASTALEQLWPSTHTCLDCRVETCSHVLVKHSYSVCHLLGATLSLVSANVKLVSILGADRLCRWINKRGVISVITDCYVSL
jgi:hypothetical protein